VTDRWAGYTATPELERELARHGTAQLAGGRYRATVATAGKNYYEGWTDSLPFVYGRPAKTLQGALDNLEAAVREADARRQAS
jgi:hypothetical protein